jgi:hypothetical protein
MSFLTPLVADVDPSESPSLSLDPEVWFEDVVAFAVCGMDKPRL